MPIDWDDYDPHTVGRDDWTPTAGEMPCCVVCPDRGDCDPIECLKFMQYFSDGERYWLKYGPPAPDIP